MQFWASSKQFAYKLNFLSIARGCSNKKLNNRSTEPSLAFVIVISVKLWRLKTCKKEVFRYWVYFRSCTFLRTLLFKKAAIYPSQMVGVVLFIRRVINVIISGARSPDQNLATGLPRGDRERESCHTLKNYIIKNCFWRAIEKSEIAIAFS